MRTGRRRKRKGIGEGGGKNALNLARSGENKARVNGTRSIKFATAYGGCKSRRIGRA